MGKINLSDIKWYNKNNKDHPRQQIDLLKKMITEYGYDSPIIINKDNIIIAGHGRLKALQELVSEWHKEFQEVEVIVKDKLTKKQEQKYRLLDNKITELATSNIDNIKLELEELEDLELNELYPDIEINEIELDEANEDSVPEPQKEAKLVKIWDIFQLGNHRIMCGDSTDIKNIEQLQEWQLFDMVITDPPYNTGMTGGAEKAWLSQMFNDSYTDEERNNFMNDFVGNYYMSMKDNSVAYICLDWRRNHELVKVIKDNGFKLSNIIIRDKMVHWLGSDYKYTYELINVCKKGEPYLETHQWDREYSDVWHIQRKMGTDKDHATKKPIELCERPIRHWSKEKDIVWDLFLWSWSTLIACEKTNRICYGMELDAVYIEVILKRYNDYTKWAREIKCLNRTLDLNPILNG